MEIGGYGFEKSRLLKIIEEIYSLKSKKQDLELTLYTEQFHYKYIPKRRDMVRDEVYSRLLLLIPLTIVLAICFYCICFVRDGLILLPAMLIFVFGGYTALRLWKREIKMFTLLWLSLRPENAAVFWKKFDINTFQNDEANSRNRIEMLEAQIAHINQQITQLQNEQKQLLEHKNEEENLLKEKGVLFDSNPKVSVECGKFSLREESIGMGNAHDLFEFYSKEEQYTKNYLLQLEGKLQRLDKQIHQIEDDFQQVKKILICFAICFVLLIIIQSAFSGVWSLITSMICFAVSLAVCLYLEKRCSPPIIMYLLEHDSNLVQEYAFRHNMVPVHVKREEMLHKMKYLQNELDDIRNAKNEIIFD